MLRAGTADHARLEGLSQDRRAVFPGGVVILLVAFKALSIRKMQTADGAFRPSPTPFEWSIIHSFLGVNETGGGSEMTDMFGFSRREQKLLPLLVRADRRKFPVQLFRELPEKHARNAERLAILLRAAVVLHRSRSPEPLPDFSLSEGKRSLKLRFPDGWLDEHALTRADLEQESAYLKAGEFKLGFA
jgi:exopolyphosphatase/pppGpp-phosphohydrolase